jgi:ADP-heptose:LPS heptosyltransferase
MKILVISFAGIGDTIFVTPLIHELRENFPDAILDVFVRWHGAETLLQNNPYLNTVYQKDIAEDSKLDAFAFLTKLRRVRYDVSINTFPQSRRDYRLVARFIGAQTRISHEYDNFSPFDKRLINKSLPLDYSLHAVDLNLSLLQFLGAKPKLPSHRYELFPTDAEQTWAANYIAQQQLQSRPLLGIHVGSGGTKNLALRRWPLENYIELVRRLGEKKPDVSVLFFGGPGEKKDHETIRSAIGAANIFFPDTENLLQTAALIGKCHSFLSVDTSLMHIAAAMGVAKQIVIETPTWNKPIEPYGQSFTLVKNPAVAGRNLDYYRYDGEGIKGTPDELLRCMTSVTVDDVMDAVIKSI